MISPIVLIFINIFLVVIGQFLLKKGMNLIGGFEAGSWLVFFTKVFTSAWVLIGLSIYIVGSLLWFIVLSKVDLSFAYPLISLSYILVFIVSVLFLGESFSLLRLLGVGFIMLGVFFISRS